MDPEEQKIDDLIITISGDDTFDPIDLGKFKITVDNTYEWTMNDTYYDNSYSVIPEASNPSVYTSYDQRELHEKYPALKKAWEDYLNMYSLSQGEPPNVE